MSDLPMVSLKHTNYYWVGEDRVQFKAEVVTESFFKVPVAKFIWPNKRTEQVKVETFTGKLIFSAELPFDVEYSNGVWKANLRRSV